MNDQIIQPGGILSNDIFNNEQNQNKLHDSFIYSQSPNSNNLSNEENLQLKKQISKLTETIAQKSSEIKNLVTETDKRELVRIERENQMKKTIDELNTKIKLQKDEISQISDQRKNLQTQISDFLLHFSSKTNSDFQSLKSAYSFICDTFDTLSLQESQICNLKESKKSLKKQIKQSQYKADSSVHERDMIIKKLRRAIKIQEQESIAQIDKLKAQVEILQESERNAEKEVNLLKRQLQLNEQLNSSQLKLKMGETHSSENEKEVILKTGTVQLEIYKTKIANLTQKLKNAEQTIKEQKEKIENYEQKKIEICDEFDKTSNALEALQDHLDRRDNANRILFERLNESKNICQNLEISSKEKDIELVSAKTTIRELQQRLADFKNYEDQTKQQNISNELFTNNNIATMNQKCEKFDQSLKQFDMVISNQAQQIKELSDQKNSLAKIINESCSALSTYENIIKDITKSRNQALVKISSLEQDIKEYQNASIKNFEKIIDSIILFPNLPMDIQKLLLKLKSSIVATISLDTLNDHNENDNIGIQEFVQDLVRIFFDYYEQVLQDENFNAEKFNELDSVKRNYSVLLKHFEEAVRFMRKTTGCTSDLDFRTSILQQCAIMSRFIDSQKLNIPMDDFIDVPQLFNPQQLTSPKKMATLLFDFIPEEKLKESPYFEIFMLFSCVAHLNNILISQITEANCQLENKSRIISNASLEQDQLLYYQELIKSFMPAVNKLSIYFANELAQSETLLTNLNDDEKKNDEEIIKSFLKLTDEFFDRMNQTQTDYQLTKISRNEYIQKNEELKMEVQKLKEEIQKINKKYQKQKSKFCKKADNLVDILEQQFQNEIEFHENESISFCSKLEVVQSKFNELKTENASKISSLQKKLEEKQQECNSLKKNLEEKNQELEAKENVIIQEQNSKKQELAAEKSISTSLSEENKKLKGIIEELTLSKSEYKQKYQESEEKNNTLLNQIKKKTDDLSIKYDNQINELESRLSEAQKFGKTAKEEIDGFSDYKQQLQLENARLTVSNRSLTLKLQSVQQQLSEEKRIGEAKAQSIAVALRAESDSKTNDLKAQIEIASNALFQELKQDYDIELEGTENLEILTNLLLDNLEKRMKSDNKVQTQDAILARKILDLSPSDTLSNAVRDQINNLNTMENEIKNEKNSKFELKREMNILQHELIRLNTEKEKAEIWDNWARSLYSSLGENTIIDDSQQLRKTLETMLMSTIGHRSISRQFEILRSEKKILNTMLSKTGYSTKSQRRKIPSLRPLMLVFLSLHQIQMLSGTVPPTPGISVQRTINFPPKPIVPLD